MEKALFVIGVVAGAVAIALGYIAIWAEGDEATRWAGSAALTGGIAVMAFIALAARQDLKDAEGDDDG